MSAKLVGCHLAEGAILEYHILTDVLYIDFRNAFDSVNYKYLLERLKSSGLGTDLLAWLKGFLTRCLQRVRVGSGFSSLGTDSGWVL